MKLGKREREEERETILLPFLELELFKPEAHGLSRNTV